MRLLRFVSFCFYVVIWLLLIPDALTAQISLPAVISDHMVLQQKVPVPVWGTAAPGEEINVVMATKSSNTTTGPDGKWEVELPSLEAGGPHTLTITSTDQSIEIQDVKVGEVWLCSGQSNMEWALEQSATAETEVPLADYPDIRLFLMKKNFLLDANPFTPQTMQAIDQGDFYRATNWQSCTPETAANFSAVAYHFGRKLYDSLKVPIGLIQNAVGGSPIQSWISMEGLKSHPQLEYLTNNDPGNTWHYQPGLHPWVNERAIENLQPWLNSLENKSIPLHPFGPAYLFDTGIKPLLPYPVNGMIWYQGESDATNPELYPFMFQQFVSDFRTSWSRQDLPVIFVQLPKIGNRSRWPEFRQAQAECLKIPNTAMVVSIDTGHPTDVHPREKKTIGERMAAVALGKWYHKQVPYQWPTLAGWNRETNAITLIFEHVGDGLMVDGDMLANLILDGYVENGTKSLYLQADSLEVSENKVVIYLPVDFELTEIKYAWVPYPDGSLLYNSYGLPAAPFKIELPSNY